jgi:hypothetical protein
MSNRRKFVPNLFVPLFTALMGFVAFFNMASSPRFATFHAVDVVRLIAAGMCFGAALVGLVMFFRSGRSS